MLLLRRSDIPAVARTSLFLVSVHAVFGALVYEFQWLEPSPSINIIKYAIRFLVVGTMHQKIVCACAPEKWIHFCHCVYPWWWFTKHSIIER